MTDKKNVFIGLLLLVILVISTYHVQSIEKIEEDSRFDGIKIGRDLYQGTPASKLPFEPVKTVLTFNESDVTALIGIQPGSNSCVETEWMIVATYDEEKGTWKDLLLVKKN